jgi:hypothetical protein
MVQSIPPFRVSNEVPVFTQKYLMVRPVMFRRKGGTRCTRLFLLFREQELVQRDTKLLADGRELLEIFFVLALVLDLEPDACCVLVCTSSL